LIKHGSVTHDFPWIDAVREKRTHSRRSIDRKWTSKRNARPRPRSGRLEHWRARSRWSTSSATCVPEIDSPRRRTGRRILASARHEDSARGHLLAMPSRVAASLRGAPWGLSVCAVCEEQRERERERERGS